MIIDEIEQHVACIHDNTSNHDDESCRLRRHAIAARRVPRFLALVRAACEADRYFGQAA